MPGENGLITTTELADQLGRPELRLFDCTTYLEPAPANSTAPYTAVPGRHSFEAGHIPGADFLDLQGEFSVPDSPLHFMMPGVVPLEAAFGRHGVSAGSIVVLYCLGAPNWATRFWWMLQSLGFDALVLDGGFDTWKAEGRPVETGPARGYQPATFKAKPKAGYFIGKDDVLAAGRNTDTVVVNALGPQFHRGLEPSRYGRPGRIPGSCNLPSGALLDPGTKTFLPLAEAEAKFAAQGFRKDKRVVAYCGGGIAATVDLFVLHRLGYKNLTLYDGSMGEWAKDNSLPIETD
jgi:thiosulfate/3-mercaptopyruvate sulfurtransferase